MPLGTILCAPTGGWLLAHMASHCLATAITARLVRISPAQAPLVKMFHGNLALAHSIQVHTPNQLGPAPCPEIITVGLRRLPIVLVPCPFCACALLTVQPRLPTK